MKFAKKFSKPTKQTVLKGLLLLVVGVNFSWKPIFKESHSITMAQSAVPAKETETVPVNITDKKVEAKADPLKQVVTVCGNKNVGVTVLPDGTSMKIRLLDDKNNEVDCEECKKRHQMNLDFSGPMPKDAVSQVLNELNLSCDALKTEQEVQAEKDRKLAIKKSAMKCETDDHGKELSANRAYECELKNISAGDEKFKEAGFTQEEANDIRQDLANDAMSSVAATCKTSQKEDIDFDDCERAIGKLKGSVSKMTSKGNRGNKALAAVGRTLTDKVGKLENFVAKEKKVVKDVEDYKSKFEKIQAAMDSDIVSMTNTCNANAGRYGGNFDADACALAYERKYLPQKYGTQIRQLTNAFTTEERKLTGEIDGMKKLDFVGSDGAKAAIAPYIDFTKTFSNFSEKYSIPVAYLPANPQDSFPGNVGATATQTSMSNWVQADIDSRMGRGPERQFTPIAVNAGGAAVAGSTSVNGFNVPSVLSGGANSAAVRYQRQLPLNARSSTPATAGFFEPVSNLY